MRTQETLMTRLGENLLSVPDETPQNTYWRFTQTDCWALALELNRVFGWEIVTLHYLREEDTWVHALVRRPDGNLVDVFGVNTPDTVIGAWTAHEQSQGGRFILIEQSQNSPSWKEPTFRSM